MKFLSPSVLASFALVAAPLCAQGSILPYLPKDTIMAISAPDLSTSIAEFAQMPMAKMWAEEEVQNFLADVKEMVGKQVEMGLAQAKEMHAKGALPVDPEQLMKLRMMGGTFAVTHLEIGAGDFGPMPKFGFVLHMDFGDTAPQWNALVQMGLGMLESQAGNELTKKDVKIGDCQLLTFSPNDAQGLEMSLNVAMVPGGIVIGTLTEDVKGIVENMQKKTPVLGASAAYAATAKRLSAQGAEAELFLHMDPAIEFLMGALRTGASMSPEMQAVDMDGVERAIKAMGLRNLGAMGATSNYVDGKCVSRAFHRHGAGDTTAAPAKTIDTAFLKWVPKDAVSFSSGTMNVMSFYDTVLAGLKAYDEQFAKQALEQLAGMEQQLGFNVREDLFGSFGDHYVNWSMPMGSITSAPEMAFLVKITDEEKLVKVLKNLAKLTNGMVEIEEGEKRGLKAYQVRVNFDPTQGMGGMNPFDMITPTFAFKNGYIVAGFSATDVKRVFQRMDREDDPKGDIRSNKEYTAAAGSLPKSLESLSFTDWKAQFESLYQMATGLLAFVPMGEDVPIDMSLLPDSGTLTKHLFGSVSYSTSDATGSESVTVSPFGPEMGLFLGAAIAAGAATVGAMNRGF